jgi:hypothetical protein
VEGKLLGYDPSPQSFPMSRRSIWKITIIAAAAVGTVITSRILFLTLQRVKATNLTGVVLIDDPDIRRQRPIPNVRVEVDNLSAITDGAGLFHIKLPPSSLLASLSLTLQHPEYLPLHHEISVDGRLYVFRMKPITAAVPASTGGIPVSDVRVRYTEATRTSIDTGSVLRAFDVINKGNVPCDGHQPCSPDGKWKAAIGGASLDAGEGGEFREARVTCVAGPCPFTRIEHDDFSRSARNISVTVRDWSDSASFVLEAEVARTDMSDLVRLSYPFIFASGLNFSLPPSGEGPSIEANVGGQDIIYPLGPGLNLTWATCTLQIAADQTKNYRCDLKPEYRFQ